MSLPVSDGFGSCLPVLITPSLSSGAGVETEQRPTRRLNPMRNACFDICHKLSADATHKRLVLPSLNIHPYIVLAAIPAIPAIATTSPPSSRPPTTATRATVPSSYRTILAPSVRTPQWQHTPPRCGCRSPPPTSQALRLSMVHSRVCRYTSVPHHTTPHRTPN
jgi:hypothetical protein